MAFEKLSRYDRLILMHATSVVIPCRWRSFYRGASVSLYIGLYALGFLMSSLSTLSGFIPVFIYLSYMSLFVLAFYYAMGALGFGASLWFVYSIFRAVKTE